MDILQQYGIVDVAVLVGMIGALSTMRLNFLDKLLEKVPKTWIKFLILIGISIVLSFTLTALVHIEKFNWLNWLKMSGLNFLFSYVFHDTVKNLFFKKD